MKAKLTLAFAAALICTAIFTISLSSRAISEAALPSPALPWLMNAW